MISLFLKMRKDLQKLFSEEELKKKDEKEIFIEESNSSFIFNNMNDLEKLLLINNKKVHKKLYLIQRKVNS